MKLVDKMKDENLGLAILYNFTKGYGHVPMSVYDVVLPFLYHDGFRNHLFEGVEVEEALTKCVQEDASFIQNILDTIEKDKEMTSRALGICLLNKYLSFEFEDNEMKGIYHESSILDINEAINLGKFFSGKSYEDILNILKKKSSSVVFLDSVCLGDDVDLSKLNQFGQVTIYKQSNPEEVIERIKEADIIITNKCLLTEEVLQYASKVKLICITATGVNNVDLDYCHRRGITVCNVAGYSSLSVAQHTFARLVEKTGRPVIVVSIDENGEGKGSGRSVQGFNLHECIASCADLLLRFGGHAMAAGLSVRAENLPALRRRMNDWAARECPVLYTPPLECDLSIRLDRVTVESVARLDQLAPYGAENPTPVFLLEKAVVEGIYPVSEGKHCRLRLRQGNASIYAVWFGMHPEQLPYAMGDVVDAALNLSVYESARGPQLSGRVIELHPAGLGHAVAEQTALVQALRRGTPLQDEQKKLIAPVRGEIITVYRELQTRRWHAEDLQPLFAKLGEQQTGKTLVALTALEQVGLIAAVEHGGAKFWELVPTAGKKNLADAPILKCLEGE